MPAKKKTKRKTAGKKKAARRKKTTKKKATRKKKVATKKRVGRKKKAAKKKKTTRKKKAAKKKTTRKKKKTTRKKKAAKKKSATRKKKTASKKTTKKKKKARRRKARAYRSQAFFDHFREKLLEKRGRIERRLHDLRDELRGIQERPRELEEWAQEEKDRDILIRLEQREQEELRRIQTALTLINSRQYGKCQECGRPILRARLEEIPTAFRCIRHSG
jgi:RNA polymerase-binding protein DksA